MKPEFLMVKRVERMLARGGVEALDLELGVNLLIGRPNTGKTKWLQTLDYLLGDTGDSPYDDDENPTEGISEKYVGARACLVIAEEELLIERRWKESGVKTKVFVNGAPFDSHEFQVLLLEKLGIPLLSFPKGNPMSGQTWPHLSFRILLRHIYRQQRFWSGVADLQSEPEQHAALLQFLGLAESIFTEEFGTLVKLKLALEKLRARRQQHAGALNDLALEVLSEPELSVDVNEQSVSAAASRLRLKQDELLSRRSEVLSTSLLSLKTPDRSTTQQLGDQRAALLTALEELQRRLLSTAERRTDMHRYANSLRDELERIQRANDAGQLLADLKVTHCPACDQTVQAVATADDECFLCHQDMPDEILVEDLGSVRLRFEGDRIKAELTEAIELLTTLESEVIRVKALIAEKTEELRTTDDKLAPVRQSLSAIVQDQVSAIDMQLGEFTERQRHIKRLGDAVESGKKLDDEIARIEGEIAPLKANVDESIQTADFDLAASRLEEGMNAYLSAINSLHPGVWMHGRISVTITRNSFAFRVGSRQWHKALGGTNTLYFLMAYHYGLLTLSAIPGCHYPGISIIDFPAEFSGEQIANIENFVVQPFVDLLATDTYQGAQAIITGPSFTGLAGAHRVNFSHVYAAR